MSTIDSACACVHLLLNLHHHDHVQDGATALIVAAHKGYCGVVRILLEAKADVHIKTNVSHIYIGIII